MRDQAEQKALGKMGMMGKYRDQRGHVVLWVHGVYGAESGERVCLSGCLTWIWWWWGRRKYHRVYDYVDGILRRRLEERMDEPGAEMVTMRVEDELVNGKTISASDGGYGGGGGESEYHSGSCAFGGAEGDVFCEHHAGVQYAVFVLVFVPDTRGKGAGGGRLGMWLRR